MAQGDFLAGLQVLQPADDGHHVAGNIQLTGLPGAHGEEDVGEAHGLQFLDRGSGGVQLHFHAHLEHQGHVLVDGVVADAEGGNDLADHAAQAVGLLKDGDGDTGPAQEVGCGHTGGAAADDGDLAAVACGHGSLDLRHIGVIALLGGHQLGGPDLDGLIVVVPGALGLAAVGADGAGDEGQGVLLRDEPQGGGVLALAAQLNVLGNVLLDGAAALAGRGEAVHQGDLLIQLPPGQGLDVLHMVLIGPGGQGQSLNGTHIHAGEGLEVHGVQLVADLDEPLVAARFQLGGGHGDGPDAAGKQLVDVESVGTAGVGDAQLAAEFLGDAGGHGGGQGEQALARHVHFLTGQFAGLHIHGEGVGQLQTEFQAVLSRQSQQAAEHGNGVLVLQIFLEMVVIKGNVVIAHTVQDGPGGLVAQDGRIALDEGVQMLLLNEVRGNALDLIRWAAVEGGDRHAAGDMGGDGVDVSALLGEELLENTDALLENGGGAGVDHAVEEVVDLLTLDARQVVAHGHVEHETVGVAQAVDLAHDLQRAPGLHILLKGLLDIQLGGPLAVVALILRQDAGTVDAGCQVGTVHLLDGLQLEETGTAEVAGDDVLSQLGVGTGGGAEGSLDGLAEDGQLLYARLIGLVDAKHGAIPLVFGGDPGHQFPEGNGNHQFRHIVNSSYYFLKMY